MIRVWFFASLREHLDTEFLEVDSTALHSVADLKRQLESRDGLWREAFEERPILAAVNRVMAHAGTPIQAGDEVAFFPPVTGG